MEHLDGEVQGDEACREVKVLGIPDRSTIRYISD